MRRRALRTFWVTLAAVGAVCAPAMALTASNVLVLYNAASPEGAEIASYYTQVHPGARTLAIQNVPTTEQVTWDVYLNAIRPQVLAALNSSTDCLVTTKGLPLRIDNPKQTGDPLTWNRYSSLESELTRIDTISTRVKMGDQTNIFPSYPARNPYYGIAAAFSYSAYGTRLTARLDGFNVTDVKTAISRAQRGVIGLPGAQFLVDDYPNKTDGMEMLVNNVLIPRQAPYTYDATTAFIQNVPGYVQGYVSHGVHGGAPANYVLDSVNGLQVAPIPGAVFHTWESFNAYSFNQGGNRNGQGLIADWIHIGGTAGTGNVEEPTASLLTVTNENILFDRLLAGYTWAEAAWAGTYQLSYVNTVAGDPLMKWRPWVRGDVNLDGLVDTQDFRVFKMHMGLIGDYDEGDLNWDNLIDAQDFTILKANFGQGSAVPEPATMLLLALGAAALLRRR